MTTMKILLVQPPKTATVIGGEDIHIYEPLDLEYLAAAVDSHHEVKILDMRLEKDLQAVFHEFKPAVVGMTAYTTHVNMVKTLFKQIKTWAPETLTVVGGHHSTASPEDFQIDAIDVIVVGEGVFSFQDIIRKFEKGEYPRGASAQDNGKKIYKASKVEDLDANPFPKRELTKKYRNHYHSEWMKPLATMVTSKGCPYRCNFCHLWKLTDGKYLKRKPENIVRELKSIEEKYIFFADAESLVDEERMEELAQLIKKENIKKKFYLYGRSDTIANAPKLIELWRDIGLERVFVGFESFKKEDLLYVQKESTVKDNENAIKILKDLDIEIIASFLIRPDFSKEDFRAFGQYCRNLKLFPVLFSTLTPLPGTDLYEEVKSQLITNNYDHFDLAHSVLPTKLPLKEFYKEFFNLYKRASSLKGAISFYKKYPLKDVPKAIRKSYRNFLVKIKNAHKDYQE
jgi:radical SAM superfamily enzyme YgiQ (UPF0313 family)